MLSQNSAELTAHGATRKDRTVNVDVVLVGMGQQVIEHGGGPRPRDAAQSGRLVANCRDWHAGLQEIPVDGPVDARRSFVDVRPRVRLAALVVDHQGELDRAIGENDDLGTTLRIRRAGVVGLVFRAQYRVNTIGATSALADADDDGGLPSAWVRVAAFRPELVGGTSVHAATRSMAGTKM